MGVEQGVRVEDSEGIEFVDGESGESPCLGSETVFLSSWGDPWR